MTIKPWGRSALMIAAAVMWWSGSEPACAATSKTAAEVAKPAGTAQTKARRTVGAPVMLKKFAENRFRHIKQAHAQSQIVESTEIAKPSAGTAIAANWPADSTGDRPVLSDLVANARAQLGTSEPNGTAAAPPVAASAEPAAAPDASKPSANTEIVASDMVNDIDLADSKPKLPEATLRPVSDSSTITRNDDSIWPETSLIGKIFIAFGGFLTLASAARMFIA